MCPGCRATLLSRYNPEPLCGPCSRATSHTSVQVPVWVWDSKPMREALARLDLGAVVSLLRAAAGLTQADMAELVPGWTKTKVTRIETGERATLFDIRELFAWADAVAMPREALLPLILGRADAALDVGNSRALEDGSMDRRTFNTAAVGVAAGLMLPAEPTAASQVPARVDSAHIRYLKSCLDGLWTMDWSAGGVSLLRQATALLTRAKAMLEESDYTQLVGRQLQALTGGLGVCGGFIAFDAGEQPLARRLLGESVLLASGTGDAVLNAHAYLTMALQSTALARVSGQKGLAREALRFLDLADEHARHEPSPRLHALIATRRAVAAALLGDELASRHAITRARRELDRGLHEADPHWLGFVTGAEITGHEACAQIDLGRPAAGIVLYQQVLDDRELPARNRAFYAARLSTSLLAEGDVPGAVAQARTVLPVLEGPVKSVRTLNELRRVRDASADDDFSGRFDTIAASMATE
ncbi:hypothetical protein GCM10009780_42570 [Actinomadura alba]